MIRARMRTGASWHDVCILNLSRRGLGIQAADPPPRGSYVEICRGRHVIVARVIWARGHRAGLQSQDLIWVQALLNEGKAAANDSGLEKGLPRIERRAAPRSTRDRHEHSRIVARAMELVCIVAVGVGMGMAAFGLVQEALARPLSHIRSALG